MCLTQCLYLSTSSVRAFSQSECSHQFPTFSFILAEGLLMLSLERRSSPEMPEAALKSTDYDWICFLGRNIAGVLEAPSLCGAMERPGYQEIKQFLLHRVSPLITLGLSIFLFLNPSKRTCYIAKDDLRLLILLPLPPKG